MVRRKLKSKTASRDQGRVLLVADHPHAVVSTKLRQAGLEIVEVATQTAALVSLQRSRPHLVVADESLLSLSAAEMGRLLAQDNGLPWLLVGTAPASLERRRVALQAGAFDYFCVPEELDLLAARALQLVSLRQTFERLRGEADLDSLTGLANRRRFRTVLKREVERWRRYGVPCALILLDIDHMKAINDRFGHPSGDQVIRTVAALLSDVSRDNDTAARLGGEEFALLLANIGGAKAAQAAERLRAALAQQEVQGVSKFTVSVGVAACPENADSDRALYSASDRALYVAKNEGRNRVSVAPPLQADLPGMHASSQ